MSGFDLAEARRQLQEAGRYMLENGLAWGNAGNISLRHGADPTRCLISASGTNLGSLAPEDLVDCALAGGEHPVRRPSKELPMHAAVYQARPEIGAVLHGAPFAATLAACSDLALPSDWFVEDMYYLERIARVGYHHPGSQALADAVGEAASLANVLLLENHGVLVYDTSLREALMALHTLEMVSGMVLAARGAGLSMRPVPPQSVYGFLNDSGYRPRRQWGEG